MENSTEGTSSGKPDARIFWDATKSAATWAVLGGVIGAGVDYSQTKRFSASSFLSLEARNNMKTFGAGCFVYMGMSDLLDKYNSNSPKTVNHAIAAFAGGAAFGYTQGPRGMATSGLLLMVINYVVEEMQTKKII